jgi:hypothetical protein
MMSDDKVYPQDHREMIRQQMVEILGKHAHKMASARNIYFLKRAMKEMLYQNGYNNDSSSFIEVALVNGYTTVYHPATDIQVTPYEKIS